MIFVPPEQYVGVLGDTHGDLIWEFEQIRRFHENGVGTVLHLGDFGLGLGDPSQAKLRLNRLDRYLAAHLQTWLVTPGNHEHWGRLLAKKPAEDGLLWFGQQIAFIPPGHRWQWRGKTFVSLGGAPSVDRDARVPYRSWWPEEVITEQEVQQVIADGQADIMLTHDAPAPATRKVQHILDRNPQGWPTSALAYAAENRERLTRAFEEVQPYLLLHGHMHVSDRNTVWLESAEHHTEIVSMACNEMPRNAGVIDLHSEPDELRFIYLR